MSNQTKPPGKTFKERWPDDVAEANFLAGPWILFALAGLLGLLGIPLILARGLVAVPLLFAALLGLGVLLTVALSRANGKARHRLTRAWKSVAWVVAATILGLAIDLAAGALCDEACRIAVRADPVRSPPGLITYLLLVVGTMGITILVDGWGTSLRRRASSG